MVVVYMRSSPAHSKALVVQPAPNVPSDASAAQTAVGQYFCQIYDLISARNGRVHQISHATPDTAQQSRYLETQLKVAHGALARARDSIAHVELRLEAERSAREAAEAQARAEQDACNEAMRLLD